MGMAVCGNAEESAAEIFWDRSFPDACNRFPDRKEPVRKVQLGSQGFGLQLRSRLRMDPSVLLGISAVAEAGRPSSISTRYVVSNVLLTAWGPGMVALA